jgi:hypothetical protein
MEITTSPCCRVGSQGQTLSYVVRAKGASEIVAPANGMDGMQVRVVDTRQTPDGVEAQVQVKVLSSKPV